MLTLPLNRSRSSQGHDLCIHCSTLVIDTSCLVWLKSVHRIFEGFLPYMGMAAILVMYLDYLYIHWLPPPIDASRVLIFIHIKFGFDWQVVSDKTFEYYGDIHVYCPGVIAYEPLGSFFFQNH